MQMKYLLIAISFLLLTACVSQSDLDAANARTAQAQQYAAVQEQRANDAQSRADALSFQTFVKSDTAVLAILVVGVLGLVVILALSAPSLAEYQAQTRRDRLHEFELENERAQILLEAKRLQLQQRQQAQALPATRRVIIAQDVPAPQLPRGQ